MILGLIGHAGCGKDTFADHLVNKYGFCKVSFADPMKRFCKEVYDFSDEQLWGPSEKRNAGDPRYKRKEEDLSPRYALQTLGTEWGRACYSNTWVEYAIRVATKLLQGGFVYDSKAGLLKVPNTQKFYNGIVFPDCRFKNEVGLIKDRRGTVVRIHRPGYNGNVGIAGHASEEEQKSILDSELDAVLENPEGLENYYKEIDKVMPGLIALAKSAVNVAELVSEM